MGHKQTNLETKGITRPRKSWMKDFILEALLSQDGRCANTSVLLCALLQPPNTPPTRSHQVLSWWGPRGGLYPPRCETSTRITSHIRCASEDQPHSRVSMSVMSLACAARLTWKSARGISVSFCLYHSLVSYSAADAVSLVLLTSIWRPIPSHEARWNYNPTLHSLNVGTYLSHASYLYFDKTRIFEHHKMMITF